jgi:hypothetical protein
MSLRALKSFMVVLSLVACANEMQEIGGPEDNSGGSGSGASGGEDSSGGTGSGASGGAGSGAGSTGGTSSSTGSGGKGGATGAFGGGAGITGSGGSSGGSGGSTGGNGGSTGGTTGGASGAGGGGGTGGTTPTGECATMTEWVAGKQLTAAMNKGDELTYNDKVFTYAGDMMLWNFEAKCPPEGTREAWCDQESSIYKYTLVGPCE